MNEIMKSKVVDTAPSLTEFGSIQLYGSAVLIAIIISFVILAITRPNIFNFSYRLWIISPVIIIIGLLITTIIIQRSDVIVYESPKMIVNDIEYKNRGNIIQMKPIDEDKKYILDSSIIGKNGSRIYLHVAKNIQKGDKVVVRSDRKIKLNESSYGGGTYYVSKK